jgi:hypothetical protein
MTSFSPFSGLAFPAEGLKACPVIRQGYVAFTASHNGVLAVDPSAL